MAAKTVLVIDDDSVTVNLIKHHLEKKEYQVFSAPDGEAGLKLAWELMPGLILLDMNMPKKTGLQVYHEIMWKEDRKMFPVIVLTSRTEFETLFKDMNVDGFIPKPIDFARLTEEVDKIFSKKSPL